MDDRILHQLYPDDYDRHVYRLEDREVKSISSKDCVQLAKNANEEYEFLLEHPGKPAFYIVDWRVIYSALDDFLHSADMQGHIPADRSVLQSFQSNYCIYRLKSVPDSG